MSETFSVMVDIETMSTHSTAAIVSIGACKWDMDGIQDTFYIAVSLADCLRLGLHKEQDTVEWWKRQSKEAQLAWARDGMPLDYALRSYSDWLGEEGKATDHYCWGLNFDIPILENAFRVCDLPKPWKYWNLKCARTLHAFLDTGKIEKREGTYHNAKDDAVTQANDLIRIFKSL